MTSLYKKRILDDHRVDGILFPFRGKIAPPSGEGTTVGTIVGMEINLPLEDVFFAPEKGGKGK